MSVAIVDLIYTLFAGKYNVSCHTMFHGVNDAAIVLDPKLKNHVKLEDFGPINLCNVIYKIIFKCLVNHCGLCWTTWSLPLEVFLFWGA